ncbi:heme oxygenase [Leeuwenhoekiella aestuarii]|uniref:Heme oxygenase n=1 Tax=Leeuwenhoekiella aestuarii TaxID=2249426 RepID=A0A4Q0NWK2_9FLAO|nr:biliverdin-producing heme oxygenase [Leeuwenhoekiella aestuarii]RXG15706.1 heme oxygenase [Leeuwenhoekiella aestuarii]RXG17185.1 heme oxygenase [Leeuwenhoekiella aestuarii]
MILKHLKKQTANLHQETEQGNLAKYILDHSITTAQYKALLKQNYKAYAILNSLLKHNEKNIPANLQHFADDKKVKDLELDLSQIAAVTPEITFDASKILSPAEILGMLYVVEGSMMGGLLIRKNLESCSNLDAVQKHHFFGKNPPEVLNRWKSFTAAVESQDYSETEMDAAVKGANYAFLIFKNSYEV